MNTSVKVATEVLTEDTTFGALKLWDEVENGMVKIRVDISGCDGDEGVVYALLHSEGPLRGIARTCESREKVKKIIKGK